MPDESFSSRPIVLAMTGASGAIYSIRLLECLLCIRVPIHLTISSSAASVLRQELGVQVDLNGVNVVELLRAGDRLLCIQDQEISASNALPFIESGGLHVHHFQDYFTPIASGSFLTRGMVVCPCSGSTLSGIAHASSQNLIQRAADIHLKEGRKLIVVPRETPLNAFQLENMQRLAQLGVVVLPASPGWYHGVSQLVDLVDFVVARILDQLGLENQLMSRWANSE